MGRLKYPEASQHYLMTGVHDKGLKAPQDPEEASESSATRFCWVLRGAQSPCSERILCFLACSLSGSGSSCELQDPEMGDIAALVFPGRLLIFFFPLLLGLVPSLASQYQRLR